jgi:hypothetical protein
MLIPMSGLRQRVRSTNGHTFGSDNRARSTALLRETATATGSTSQRKRSTVSYRLS